MHLAHPLGIKGFTNRRVKNDKRDAADLADLLRMGRLPEAHIAPEPVRALRELVRHRAKLARWRSAVKNSVHAVLAKRGVTVPMSDLFGIEGTALLDALCGNLGGTGTPAGCGWSRSTPPGSGRCAGCWPRWRVRSPSSTGGSPPRWPGIRATARCSR